MRRLVETSADETTDIGLTLTISYEVTSRLTAYHEVPDSATGLVTGFSASFCAGQRSLRSPDVLTRCRRSRRHRGMWVRDASLISHARSCGLLAYGKCGDQYCLA